MAYKLRLDRTDMSALMYIAGRYESAQVLFWHLELVNLSDEAALKRGEMVEWQISEPGAWEYMDTLAQEDGGQVIPPMAGGHLAQELLAFYNKIV